MIDDWSAFGTALGIGVGSAVAFGLVVHLVLRGAARRHASARALVAAARRPWWTLLLLGGLWAGAAPTLRTETWWPRTSHVLTIVLIATVAWLLVALVSYVTDVTLIRNPTDVPDNTVARRLHTQTLLLRRLATALVVVIAHRRHPVHVRCGACRGREHPGVGRHHLRGRRPCGAIGPEQHVRRRATGVQQRAARGRRDCGRGRMGTGRGDHPELRGAAPVGRPPPGAAVHLLHQQPVPKLDAPGLGAARLGGVRPRLAGLAAPHARTPQERARGDHPVRRPHLRAAGHRRHGRLRARAHSRSPPKTPRRCGTCAATCARPWCCGCKPRCPTPPRPSASSWPTLRTTLAPSPRPSRAARRPPSPSTPATRDCSPAASRPSSGPACSCTAGRARTWATRPTTTTPRAWTRRSEMASPLGSLPP